MKINFKNILIALIEKEFKSYIRSINNLMNMIVFMIAIIILFPLTMGPSEEKLTLVSNAIVWIALIISIIPTLDKIYISDFKNGWLEQYYYSPLLLEIIILIKCFVFWFFLIIPLSPITIALYPDFFYSFKYPLSNNFLEHYYFCNW